MRGRIVTACADSDPWRGFVAVVRELTALNMRNRGFVDAFMSSTSEAAQIAAHRKSLLASIELLAKRAKAAGGLRPDFVIDDLVLILLAGRGLSSADPVRAEQAADRFANLALAAFEARRP
jgi:hypothetical protein